MQSVAMPPLRDRLVVKLGIVCCILFARIHLFLNACLQLYHQESIYLVLVGVEVWTTGDKIAVNESAPIQTLYDFCAYRTNHINPYHKNDNAQLLT